MPTIISTVTSGTFNTRDVSGDSREMLISASVLRHFAQSVENVCLGFSSDTTDCFNPGQNQAQICLRDREQNLFQNVVLNRVEVTWFYAPRFGRTKDRVQIGLNAPARVAEVSESSTDMKRKRIRLKTSCRFSRC